MTTDVASLPLGLTAGEAIEALRRMHETLDDLSYVYVVDDGKRLKGVLYGVPWKRQGVTMQP